MNMELNKQIIMKFLISYYLFLKKICLKYNKKYLIHINYDFNIDNNDKGDNIKFRNFNSFFN